MPPEQRRYETPIAFAVVALAVLVLAYPALGGASLLNPNSDQYIAGFAFRDFAARSLREGDGFPLWNPYLFGGLPYVAAMHGDIFYPTFLLRLVMPTDAAMTWGMILHVWLAGCFTWLFLRRALGLGFFPSLVGALAYSIGGNVGGLVSPGHDGKIFVSALLPLTLLLVHRCMRDGGRGVGRADHRDHARRAHAASAAPAVPAPGGGRIRRVSRVHAGGARGGNGAVDAGRRSLAGRTTDLAAPPPRDRRLRGARHAGGRRAVLAAVRVYALLSASRWQGLGACSVVFHASGRAHQHVPAAVLRHAGDVHRPQRHPSAQRVHRRGDAGAAWPGVRHRPHEPSGAARPLVLHWRLRGLAALGAGRAHAVLLAGLHAGPRHQVFPCAEHDAVRGVLLHGDAGGDGRASRAGIRRAGPLRDRLGDRRAAGGAAGDHRRALRHGGDLRLGAARTAGGPEPAGAGGRSASLAALRPPDARRIAAAGAQADLPLRGRVGARGIHGRRSLVGAAGVLAILRTGLAAFYAGDAVTQYLQRIPQPGRVLAVAGARLEGTVRDPFLGSGEGKGTGFMVHDIRTVGGYHGNELGRYDELTGWDSEEYFARVSTPNVLRLLNVQYLYTNAARPANDALALVAGPVRNAAGNMAYLYRLPGEHPYAWVVPLAVALPAAAVMPTVQDERFDPERVAIFEEGVPVPTAPVPTTLPQPSAVRVTATRTAPGRVSLALDAPAPAGAALVVSENWYPGWIATVNGAAAPLARVDGTLIGVGVPAGARAVELTFTSPRYDTGKTVSLLVLVLGVLGALAGLVLDRRAKGPA